MGLLDQATNAVNTVTRTISNIGSAKGLTQVLDGVTGAISSFGTALSGGSNVKLPLPNPLHAYASHTYSIGIGCISDAEANAPAGANECIGSDTVYYLWAFSIVVLFIVLTIFAILSAM